MVCGPVRWCYGVGAGILLVSIVAIGLRPLTKPWITSLRTHENSLALGTAVLDQWLHPPITPLLRVYLFNMTNAEAFLNGTAKLHVDELGPFVYEAAQEKHALQWTESDVQFRTRTVYRFVPSLSNGTERDVIVAPNMVVLSVVLSSEVRGLPGFVKQSVVKELVQSTSGEKEPFLSLTVGEYLWGYEDELACLDWHSIGTSDSSEFFADDDDFFEPKQPPRPPPNFRAADGRCMFGVLAHLNASDTESVVRMATGSESIADKGRIRTINGFDTFGVWPKGSECEHLADLFEPSALPPPTDDSFDFLMNIMCRRMTARFKETVRYTDRLSALRFVPTADTFDNVECFESDAFRLPPGAMAMEKCAQGAPLAVSFPHFLHGSERYLTSITGLSAADPSSHQLYFDLDPTLGAPLGMQIRFQLNLIVSRDEDFPVLSRLASSLTLVPLLWAENGYDRLDTASLRLIEFVAVAPEILSTVVPGVTAILAMIVIVVTAGRVYGSRICRLRTDDEYTKVPMKEVVERKTFDKV